MAKKIGGMMVLSLFLVACAGQTNSGKTTVADSNAASGNEQATVSGNQVAMGEEPMDESLLEESDLGED